MTILKSAASAPHTYHRGKGYAAMLMREIANAILARGETLSLPTFDDIHGAIGLYEKHGLVTRRDPVLTVHQKF